MNRVREGALKLTATGRRTTAGATRNVGASCASRAARARKVIVGLLAVGALSCAVLASPTYAAQFGLEQSGFVATVSSAQAGGHPNFTTTVALNQSGVNQPAGSPRDIEFELPPGLVGNATSTPQCTMGDVVNNSCPADAAVGISTIMAVTNGEASPITSLIYNLVPYPTEPAAFGFSSVFPVRLDTKVRSDGDYGLDVAAQNVTGAVQFDSVSTTFWGVPADNNGPGPNGEETTFGQKFGGPGGGAVLPFLRNPTTCSGASAPVRAVADSWAHPGEEDGNGDPVLSDPHWSGAATLIPEIAGGFTGCEKLSFAPSIGVAADNLEAGAPAGYEINVHVPQNEQPEGLSTPDVKDTVITLPAGTVVSPSVASGLEACTETEIGLHSRAAASCPPASKIGSVRIETPLLAQPLEGSVYVATQASNPFGSLLAVYLVSEGAGVRVKLAGEVRADQTTGQLTVSFRDDPQLPFSDVSVRLKGGASAPLANPRECGSAMTSAVFTPWSTPFTSEVNATSRFAVAGCSPPQFAPSFVAGTASNLAGHFTSFSTVISRSDRDGLLGSVAVQLPHGLLGSIAGVPLCPDLAADAGTCPEASTIGSVSVAVGPGSEPFVIAGGEVYLTGPYRGAPFGLSIVVPAVAGPFNLGVVVVRAAIHVDPYTAQVSVSSDPLPTILQGIPIQLRQVNLTVDRPGFLFNPTSCEQQAVRATLTSTGGTSVPASAPFQAGGCRELPFSPKFAALTQGRTTKADGASLHVKVTSSFGQANIAKVRVDLPRQLPSRLTTLQKACPVATFDANPASCPASSIVGTATAVTPVLRTALTGPAYLISHAGAAFPDLETVLQGEGITLILDGTTDIKKGITSSTFSAVPDAPIDTFDLVLPEGPHSVLAANLPTKAKWSMCGQKLSMPTEITGQNGAVAKQTTEIAVSGCPKHKAARTPKKVSKRKQGKK